MEAGKRANTSSKFTGISKDSVEGVTLVYEGGTRNVKKKQWVLETTVPVSQGWRSLGMARSTKDRTIVPLGLFLNL
jgi:hypothetical protein